MDEREAREHFDNGYQQGRASVLDGASSAGIKAEQGRPQNNAMRAMTMEERIDLLFTYHRPRPDQIPKYDAIRSAAKYFAEVIMKNTVSGKDQEAALSKLRVVVMIANASVALDGIS